MTFSSTFEKGKFLFVPFPWSKESKKLAWGQKTKMIKAPGKIKIWQQEDQDLAIHVSSVVFFLSIASWQVRSYSRQFSAVSMNTVWILSARRTANWKKLCLWKGQWSHSHPPWHRFPTSANLKAKAECKNSVIWWFSKRWSKSIKKQKHNYIAMFSPEKHRECGCPWLLLLRAKAMRRRRQRLTGRKRWTAALAWSAWSFGSTSTSSLSTRLKTARFLSLSSRVSRQPMLQLSFEFEYKVPNKTCYS